jgi:hypothetical protein
MMLHGLPVHVVKSPESISLGLTRIPPLLRMDGECPPEECSFDNLLRESRKIKYARRIRYISLAANEGVDLI